MTDKDLDKALKALASGTRRSILDIIRACSPEPYQACPDKKVCACEISQQLNLSPSTISHHMSVLRSAGLIIEERDGIWVNYTINQDTFSQVCEVIKSTIETSC